MTDEELFFVRERRLDYAVFDVDNPIYENAGTFDRAVPDGNLARLTSVR
jgi:hypothetical protein